MPSPFTCRVTSRIVWMFMPISSVLALYAIARSIMAYAMSAVRCYMRYTKSAMNAWRIADSR